MRLCAVIWSTSCRRFPVSCRICCSRVTRASGSHRGKLNKTEKSWVQGKAFVGVARPSRSEVIDSSSHAIIDYLWLCSLSRKSQPSPFKIRVPTSENAPSRPRNRNIGAYFTPLHDNSGESFCHSVQASRDGFLRRLGAATHRERAQTIRLRYDSTHFQRS